MTNKQSLEKFHWGRLIVSLIISALMIVCLIGYAIHQDGVNKAQRAKEVFAIPDR
jgi:hypothetical protein